MITLIVDEAYAFDYLSILDVKKQKSSSGELIGDPIFSGDVQVLDTVL